MKTYTNRFCLVWLTFGLSLLSLASQAQQLERQLFASAGTSVGSFSIGEVFTQTYSSNQQLTQGFQQTNLEVVSVQEEKTVELRVFPNPAADQLTIQTEMSFFEYVITDLSGKVCLESQGARTEVVDVKSLAQGLYLLRITQSEDLILETHQIVKL